MTAETGPCQAVDMVPIIDDAVAIECGRPGRRVLEHDGLGHWRTRLACELHAVDYDSRPS